MMKTLLIDRFFNDPCLNGGLKLTLRVVVPGIMFITLSVQSTYGQI